MRKAFPCLCILLFLLGTGTAIWKHTQQPDRKIKIVAGLLVQQVEGIDLFIRENKSKSTCVSLDIKKMPDGFSDNEKVIVIGEMIGDEVTGVLQVDTIIKIDAVLNLFDEKEWQK